MYRAGVKFLSCIHRCISIQMFLWKNLVNFWYNVSRSWHHYPTLYLLHMLVYGFQCNVELIQFDSQSWSRWPTSCKAYFKENWVRRSSCLRWLNSLLFSFRKFRVSSKSARLYCFLPVTRLQRDRRSIHFKRFNLNWKFRRGYRLAS